MDRLASTKTLEQNNLSASRIGRGGLGIPGKTGSGSQFFRKIAVVPRQDMHPVVLPAEL